MPPMNSIAKPNVASSTSPCIWALVYFLLIIVLGGMFVWTLFPGMPVRGSLALVFLALLLLSVKRWTGALLLSLVLLHLYEFDPQDQLVLIESTSLLWVFFAVMLVVAVSRYRTLQEHGRQSMTAAFGHVWQATANVDRAAADRLVDNLKQIIIQLVKVTLVIAMCATVASFLLASVPLIPDSSGFTRREYKLVPTGYRIIVLGLKLFCIALVSWIAVNELIWRNLSQKQAGVYLRSTFLVWIHRDFRMVLKRQMKLRRKKSRVSDPTSAHRDVGGSETNAALTNRENG